MAQIDNIRPLLTLPDGIAWHTYPEVLGEYFNNISRLEDLSMIE